MDGLDRDSEFHPLGVSGPFSFRTVGAIRAKSGRDNTGVSEYAYYRADKAKAGGAIGCTAAYWVFERLAAAT